MRFDILTIFPELLLSPLKEGIIRRAIQSNQVAVAIHNIRDFATDRHAMTDDRPFGGGEGMVMKPEPLAAAINHARQGDEQAAVVLMTPQGRPFNQQLAGELLEKKHIILLCGRYEGIDERIRSRHVDLEVSVGDFILSGGELAAMVIIDTITRLVPGVLGCSDSVDCDTFSRGLLKHPQYTRPREFEGVSVPEVLLTGDHKAIAEWRLLASVGQTLERRPELLAHCSFDKGERAVLKKAGLWEEVSRWQNRHTGTNQERARQQTDRLRLDREND